MSSTPPRVATNALQEGVRRVVGAALGPQPERVALRGRCPSSMLGAAPLDEPVGVGEQRHPRAQRQALPRGSPCVSAQPSGGDAASSSIVTSPLTASSRSDGGWPAEE